MLSSGHGLERRPSGTRSSGKPGSDGLNSLYQKLVKVLDFVAYITFSLWTVVNTGLSDAPGHSALPDSMVVILSAEWLQMRTEPHLSPSRSSVRALTHSTAELKCWLVKRASIPSRGCLVGLDPLFNLIHVSRILLRQSKLRSKHHAGSSASFSAKPIRVHHQHHDSQQRALLFGENSVTWGLDGDRRVLALKGQFYEDGSPVCMALCTYHSLSTKQVTAHDVLD